VEFDSLQVKKEPYWLTTDSGVEISELVFRVVRKALIQFRVVLISLIRIYESGGMNEMNECSLDLFKLLVHSLRCLNLVLLLDKSSVGITFVLIRVFNNYFRVSSSTTS